MLRSAEYCKLYGLNDNCVPCLRLRLGYGLTETAPVLTVTPLASCASKPASAGILVRSTEMKVCWRRCK